ncbi:hypothetical protein [Winogradskya humida]|uniref:hypothetical protein n=1 Tax=Winogradskya humida TaxID=113566 RepID=UPI0019415E76|nr:hypothetical protein [Actinoplanes humidus]
MTVTNHNTFEVTATSLAVDDTSLVVKEPGCSVSQFKLSGLRSTGFPGTTHSARDLSLSPPVKIPPGEARTVTTPEVVSQDGKDGALCGVKLDFAAVAMAGYVVH